MKKLIMMILAILATGCLAQPGNQAPAKQALLNELNSTVNITQPGLITSSDQGNVQVVTIRSVNQSFPMQYYPDEFLFAGLYSDTFVMLNDSQIRWMGPDESIWLTVYKGDGSGVVFNAIYSKDVQDCGDSGLSILGKNYTMSQLRNGSSFENDDKWKVSIDSNAGCTKRVIVYLDGYFDGLKDGEQIPLFRNDNTILLGFDKLEVSPEARVIATKPAPANLTADGGVTNHYILSGNDLGGMDTDGVVHTEEESIGPGGISMVFEPAIPMFSYDWSGASDYHFDNLKENILSYIYADQSPWDIVRLRGNGSMIGMEDSFSDGNITDWNSTQVGDELYLGKARPFSVIQCENLSIGNETYTIEIMDGKILFDENGSNCTSIYSVPFNGDAGIIVSENDSVKEINGKWVQLQQASSIDAAYAQINVYDSVVRLTDDPLVSLAWEQNDANQSSYRCATDSCLEFDEYNVTFDNPALKSVFIPRTSPMFEKIVDG